MSKNKFNRNLAIIIGINNYENGIPKLETADPDALKLAQILREQHTHLKEKYQEQNQYEVQLLLNQRANLNQLNQLIEDLKKGQIPFDNEKVTVTSSDRVFFYFAGHGKALDALDNQEGPVGYLIPQDAILGNSNTYLPMQDLHDALNALPCRHMLAILDCCFAGAFRWASIKREIQPKVTVYKERYDRFITDAAWQVITSAADDQKALDFLGVRGEVKFGNEVHSPFAKALFDALLGGEGADSNQDGIITATELYSYLRDKVEIFTENNYKRQTPGLCPLKKHDKGEFIFLLPNFDRDKLDDAPELNLANNPYRGLQSYDEKDSHLFFGRENLIEKLYQKAIANKQPLTLVLGASGTGKSSLMKAGLLHRLRHSQEQKFKILDPMRPGESPLKALAQVCLPIATVTAEELAKDKQALANSIEGWNKTNSQTKLLLPIDQFEELITLCKSDEEREQFQKLLLNAIAKYPDKIHVVITLRLDFEAQFQNSVLKDFWNDETRFVVPPMTQDEFREAIEKPASEKVVYFEPPSLVDELINEVVQMPGALPLLSFTLSELYLKYLGDRTRNNRALTKKDYEELGKVIGSLTKRANDEYDRLVAEDSAYQDTVRRVMLRMISLQGGELARRQVPKLELVYPDKEENERVQTVIKRFSEARLIVEGSNPQGEPYVEPAHDALVQGWDKLLAWKNSKEEEDNIILQRRLTPAAEEWKSVTNKLQPSGLQTKAENVVDWLDRRLYVLENLFDKVSIRLVRRWQQRQNQQQTLREKPIQFLWNSNPYLDVLNEKLQINNNWFNQLETEFVQQSVLQKRRNISWRWRIAIAVMLGLSGLTIATLIGQRQALIGQVGAFRQSAEANWRSNQELDALIDSVRAAKTLKDWPWFLFKPDKELKHQVSHTLRKLYHTTKERNRRSKPIGTLVGMAPENKVLVSDRTDTLVSHLLDSEGNQIIPFSGFQTSSNPVNHSPGVTYSLDGKLLAVADIYGASWNAHKNGTVSFWDIDNKRLIQFPGHQGGVKSISFSPDSKKIATADASDTIRLWSLQDTQQFKEFKNNIYKNIVGIGFSPDNQLLVATADNDENKLSLWEIEGNQKWSELNGDGDKQKRFSRAIFSNDGQRIAIEYGWEPQYGTDESRNMSLFLWSYLEDKQNNNIIGLSNLYSFPLETNAISMSMSPDGKQLATALYDSNIRFWSLEDKKLEWEEFPYEAISVSLSADGKKLATTDKNGKVGVWNLDSRQFVSIPEIPGFVKNLSLSADGKKLAIINQDGTVGLWNLENKTFVSLNKKFSGGALESKDVNSMGVKFSLDSQQIAIISHTDKTNTVVNLWDLKTDKMQIIADSTSIFDVIFSVKNQLQKLTPDLVIDEITLSDLKNILLFKFQQSRCSFSLLNYAVSDDTGFLPVSVSKDGSVIASASSSYDSVCIWDLKNGNELARFKVPQGKIKSISLSGDSSLVAIAVDNGSILLWRIGTFNKLIELGCDRLREYLKNSTVSERDRHLCDDIPTTTANSNQ
ncbi:caspase family protein [Scytonema sp. UIC 10036]|uniref:nSTAND1 domain-containing NTPase n=1 Tax=Scytonema sp. UIC 10036 TaxID=2304196 RepID=UPI00140FEE66|nr:caspase family protein [Scytonema sp. UIC 10036]